MRKDIKLIFFIIIIFFVGRTDPNTPAIPSHFGLVTPNRPQRLQRWHKIKSRLSRPVIVRSSDLNGDGRINLYDYSILAGNWLKEMR